MKTPLKSHNSLLKKLAKIYIGLTIAFLFLFIFTALAFDPHFLARDLGEKYARVAGVTTLTLHIVGPPEKPVLAATSHCTNQNSYVLLSWNDTSDTTNYDINRNALPLVSGITAHTYQDNAVQNQTTYTYYIVANGPLGSTASDDVTATTGNCNFQTIPTCVIQTVSGTDVTNFSGTLETLDRAPAITGTTNIPNALMNILIDNGQTVIANTTANSNGYWSWTIPLDLHLGIHTINVTATDPLDGTRHASASFTFKIIKGGNGNNNVTENIINPPTAPPGENKKPEVPPPAEIPSLFKMAIVVENKNKIAYGGNNLEVKTDISGGNAEVKNIELIYEIIDAKGKTAVNLKDSVSFSDKKIIQKSINIPRLLQPGNYKIRVTTNYQGRIITAEDSFILREVPLLNLGGYLINFSEIMRSAGWILLLLLLFLLFILALLAAEHHRSTKSLFHITEGILKRKGLVNKRKGVAK